MATAERISGPLQVERLDDGRRRLIRYLGIDLKKDLKLGDTYYDGFSTSPAGHTVIKVPQDFVTNYSSIPAFARALYRFDSVDLAGCCHDYAYYVGIPRAPADEIWRLVAISGNRRVGRFRGRIGWLALRVAGGFAYRDHARRRLERTGQLHDDPGVPQAA